MKIFLIIDAEDNHELAEETLYHLFLQKVGAYDRQGVRFYTRTINDLTIKTGNKHFN